MRKRETEPRRPGNQHPAIPNIEAAARLEAVRAAKRAAGGRNLSEAELDLVADPVDCARQRLRKGARP
jgi:hypothetical protein